MDKFIKESLDIIVESTKQRAIDEVRRAAMAEIAKMSGRDREVMEVLLRAILPPKPVVTQIKND